MNTFARNVGHVIVDGALDRPWSQHFCCVLTATKNFVRKHPVATKRVLRGIYQGNRFLRRQSGGAPRKQ